MSAIGDYIYYTYFCYQKGYVSKDAPKRNFTKAFDAYKVFNDKIRELNKAFSNLGNNKMANDYQALLNLYTGNKANQKKQENLEKYLIKQFDEQLGHSKTRVTAQEGYTAYTNLMTNMDLKGMSVDAPINFLDAHYAKSLQNFKKVSQDRQQFITGLEHLLKVVKDNKGLIASVMTGNSPLESLDNRINMLKNLIKKLNTTYYNAPLLEGYTGKKNTAEYKALKRLDELFFDENGKEKTIKGFTSKHAAGSGILQEILHLLNIVLLPPNSETGIVTEFILYDIPIYAKFIGGKRVVKELSEGVIGGKKSQTAFKANAIEDTEQFLKENKQYKFQNIDGTGYIVTNTSLQEKIDVSITVRDSKRDTYEELNVSVKNTSMPIVYFIQDGSLWNMIANENYNNFINHYINVVAPKVNSQMNFLAYNSEKDKYGVNHVMTVDYEKAVRNNGNRYELAERAMNQLVIAKALAGYNTTKVSKNGSISAMKMPNYLAVFDRYHGSNQWLVMTMKDIYRFFVDDSNSNRIIIAKNGQDKNTTNPFPDSAQEVMGDSYKGKDGGEWSQDESVIKSRIANTLSFIHRRKITVFMEKTSLNYLKTLTG